METKHPSIDDTLLEGRHKKRLWSFISFFIVLLVIALIFLIKWFFSIGYVKTNDAYVHGNLIPVSGQEGGRITDIYYEQGGWIEEGATLIQLDPTSALLEIEAAKANLNDAVRKVAGFYLQAQEAKQTIALRETQLNQMEIEAEHRRILGCTRAIGEEAVLASQTQLKMAQINKELAKTAFELAQSQIQGISPYNHPLVINAKLRLQKALLSLQNTRIQAPVFGMIAQRNAQVGQMVHPGETLFTIVPNHEFWVEANFMETQLHDIMKDQPVTLTSDIYGDKVIYHGKVLGIRPGTGLSFSLIPPQNATGNWIKIIQRVPVLISLNKDELDKHPLFLGLSMEASVDIRNRFIPSEEPTRPLDTKTDVYSKQIPEIEAIANKIVEDSFAPFLEHKEIH